MSTLRILARPLRRHRTNLPIRPYSSQPPFGVYPSPPRLPTDQQAEFERLQRKAGILPPSPADLSPSTTGNINITTSDPTAGSSASSSASENATVKAEPQEQETTETSSGGVFRGAPPEFEGDTNPKTGEVGGPKNEPLRWGGQSDWSYNGRVTDF
ncbi:hypothetical protein MKZ38_007973 [Zalerion maritima]|uniref:Succinate dehydrogenase assembly factor 4, mitochondrial n=1 Tax=Zalerion maritima TaxID=339359 RepID=A0AAD5WNW7_9PEZI|nr:hypothetical protein MKZ38_007973 [Zalerion maritima]